MDGEGDLVAFREGAGGADTVVSPAVEVVDAGVDGEVQVMDVVVGGEGDGVLQAGGAGVVADTVDEGHRGNPEL